MREECQVQAHQVKGGAITPAHAGRMPPVIVPVRHYQDHPRACGKNTRTRNRRFTGAGSPPRMREELIDMRAEARQMRITPAHAGRICRRKRGKAGTGDHPRACGKNQPGH